MRSCLGMFLFSFIVFPMLMAALCMFALNTWLFDKELYIKVADNPTLYEEFLNNLPDYIDVDAFQRNFQDAQQADQADAALALAYKEVVTPEYLQTEAKSVIDDYFDMLENPNLSLDIAVDMVPVKELLAQTGEGEPGYRFATVLAQSLPPCEAGQEPRDPNSGDALISCLSSSMTPEDATTAILDRLPAYVENIPNRLVLNDQYNTDGIEFGATSAKAGYRSAMITLAVFAAIFLMATAAVAGRGTRGTLVWAAAMLAIPAAIVLFLGVSIDRTWSDVIETGIKDSTNNFDINGVPASEQLREAIAETSTIFLDRVGSGLLNVGGIAIAIAAFLFGIGRLAPKPEDRQNTVTVPSGGPSGFYPSEKPKNSSDPFA